MVLLAQEGVKRACSGGFEEGVVLLAQECVKSVWSCWFRMAWSCTIIFVFLVRDDVSCLFRRSLSCNGRCLEDMVLFAQEVIVLRMWSY